MRSAKRIANRALVLNSAQRVTSVTGLWERGSIPAEIEVFMLETPARALLRGIYGSHLKAAKALLVFVLAESCRKARWACADFWRYKILLKSPERDLTEAVEDLEREVTES